MEVKETWNVSTNDGIPAKGLAPVSVRYQRLRLPAGVTFGLQSLATIPEQASREGADLYL